MKTLIDNNNRVISYLRISVTDRCDFRCVYCMSEKMKFLAHSELITLEETARLAEVFASLGIRKIRLTGGEPLIRKNIEHLIEQLSKIKTIEQVSLTTNAARLGKMSASLYKAGLRRLNISLDTLDSEEFKNITRIGDLQSVLDSIDKAIENGFTQIRLNSIIMRGKNEKQIIPLVEYARQKSIDIAFIEEMPLGNIDYARNQTFISSSDIRKKIDEYYPLRPLPIKTAGPASYWGYGDCASKVGFISPHSSNFCDSCNRVRLTASGQLLLCLGQENSLDLKTMLRTGKTDAEIALAITQSLLNKPTGHDFDINEKPLIARYMNNTGG